MRPHLDGIQNLLPDGTMLQPTERLARANPAILIYLINMLFNDISLMAHFPEWHGKYGGCRRCHVSPHILCGIIA